MYLALQHVSEDGDDPVGFSLAMASLSSRSEA
jgi:hypothetical protein